ncbi:MAG: metal-dependent hydrolase [Candidatus Kariarchaeaceae archaeon]
MTLTTTHLGISTLVLYYLSSKDMKQEFREKPLLFFALTLGSIAPDIDLVWGNTIKAIFGIFSITNEDVLDIITGHRTWSHSLFFPLLFILSAPHIAKLKPRHDKLTRNLQIFGFMWLSHIFFDLTYGPLGLFWPLDTRFFDVTMGITFGLISTFFLPVTIGGFFVDIDPIEQSIGVATFFINWTNEDRISYFGGTSVNVAIKDFLVHVVLFFWYLLKVIFPLFREIRKYNDTYMDSYLRTGIIQYVWVQFLYLFQKALLLLESFGKFVSKKLEGNTNYRRNWVNPGILLFLIIISLYAGPIGGQEWKTQNTYSDQFYVLSDSLKLVGIRSFTGSEETIIDVTMKFDESNLDFQAFVIQTDTEYANMIKEYARNQSSLVKAGNQSIVESILQYHLFMETEIGSEAVQTVNINETGEWNLSSKGEITLLLGFYHWNISNFFFRNIRSNVTWTVPRDFEYTVGLLLSGIFTVLLLISLRVSKNRLSKDSGE